ncbi:MAG: hypothetical protein AAFV93_19550 [Chloroflexota bacterium]
MPDNKQRNPFEDHINSESFDVSYLGAIQERSDFDMEMDAFLQSLPENLDHSLYDIELDSRQQAICSYLTHTLSEQLLHDESGEFSEDVREHHLQQLLTMPVAIAMLAQQRLCEPEIEVQHPLHANPDSYRDDFSELSPNLGEKIINGIITIRDFIINLFRRS